MTDLEAPDRDVLTRAHARGYWPRGGKLTLRCVSAHSKELAQQQDALGASQLLPLHMTSQFRIEYVPEAIMGDELEAAFFDQWPARIVKLVGTGRSQAAVIRAGDVPPWDIIKVKRELLAFMPMSTAPKTIAEVLTAKINGDGRHKAQYVPPASGMGGQHHMDEDDSEEMAHMEDAEWDDLAGQQKESSYQEPRHSADSCAPPVPPPRLLRYPPPLLSNKKN